MKASANGHELVARVLLEAKADPNKATKLGTTALMKASENGHELVARALLEAKADPNKATKLGTTALMKASENGHELVARVLLENGAVVGIANKHSHTAFTLAVAYNQLACVQLLSAFGATRNSITQNEHLVNVVAPELFEVEDTETEKKEKQRQPKKKKKKKTKTRDLFPAIHATEEETTAENPVRNPRETIQAEPDCTAPYVQLEDAGDVTGRVDVAESSLGGETTCIVCFDAPKSHMAFPCWHTCACGPCSKKMDACPYCRTHVEMWGVPRHV